MAACFPPAGPAVRVSLLRPIAMLTENYWDQNTETSHTEGQDAEVLTEILQGSMGRKCEGGAESQV